MCLQETVLKEDVELVIPDYMVFRRDGEHGCSGLVTLIKKGIY